MRFSVAAFPGLSVRKAGSNHLSFVIPLGLIAWLLGEDTGDVEGKGVLAARALSGAAGRGRAG